MPLLPSSSSRSSLLLLLLLLGSAGAWAPSSSRLLPSSSRASLPASSSSSSSSSSTSLRATSSAEAEGDEDAGFPSRRRVFQEAAAAVAAALSLAVPPPALAAGDGVVVEAAIPQAKLLGGLAAASPRDVLITGANSGVGLEGAKLLVAAGHRVVLACRTQAKADAAAKACLDYAAAASAKNSRPGGTAVAMECDLANLASVRAFAKAVKGKPLDSLVLNAGLALNTGDKVPERTKDGFEMTIGVNHLGHFLLANLLVDDLKGHKDLKVDPRLVITASPVHDPTSGGGNVGSKASLGDLAGLAAGPSFSMVDGGAYDPDKAYKDSKLCNMLFEAEAARRYASRGISVNAFSPGLIPSPDGFFRYQNQGFAKTFQKISGLAGVSETSQFGGACLAYLAVDEALPKLTAGWYDTYPPGKHQLAVHAPSIEAQNTEEQQKLWQLSAKLVGV